MSQMLILIHQTPEASVDLDSFLLRELLNDQCVIIHCCTYSSFH